MKEAFIGNIGMTVIEADQMETVTASTDVVGGRVVHTAKHETWREYKYAMVLGALTSLVLGAGIVSAYTTDTLEETPQTDVARLVVDTPLPTAEDLGIIVIDGKLG